MSARPQLTEILVAAPAGALDPAIDPDDVFDMVLGAMLARTLVPTIGARGAPLERTVDLVVRLLRRPGG